jgi:CheY-like chemotaxis protein
VLPGPPGASQACLLPAADSMGPTLEGVVVLVVEDDEDALAAMRLFLEHHGALVFPASDAAAAVAVLDRIKPSVLISDIMMPVADGWWIVAEARRRGHLQDVPRVAVTALDLSPEDVSEGGFDAYLRKPVDPEALCATVHSLARGARRSA